MESTLYLPSLKEKKEHSIFVVVVTDSFGVEGTHEIKDTSIWGATVHLSLLTVWDRVHEYVFL